MEARGFNPIYALGSLDAKFVMVTDPQQSMTLQGENLPTQLSSEACGPINASMTVKDTVTTQLLRWLFADEKTHIEVAENDVLEATLLLIM